VVVLDIIKWVNDFIYTYYIAPIKYKSGYNIVQEITYGILLFVMVYIFYKVCLYLKIKIDSKFAITTAFYSFLISLIRSLVDANFVPHTYYTVTPGIVVVVGIYYMVSIIITGYFFKENYYKYSILMAVIPSLYFLTYFITHIKHLDILIYFIVILVVVYNIVIYLINRIDILKKNLKLNNIDRYVIFSQLVDGTATSLGIGFMNYWEQHPIPRFFMDIFGPYVMIPLKLFVVLVVLYIINNELEDGDLKNIIKITIMVLGLSPGLRDILRMIMGV